MKQKLFALAAFAAISLFVAPASADDRQTGGTRAPVDHSGSGADTSTGTDTGGSTSGSSSDTSSPSTNSDARQLKALLEDGYEIKSINIIPHDIVKGGGSTSDVDAVMIVIERGPELANCYVTFSSFADGSYYNGTVPICTVLK